MMTMKSDIEDTQNPDYCVESSNEDHALRRWDRPQFEVLSVALNTATNFENGGSDGMFFS